MEDKVRGGSWRSKSRSRYEMEVGGGGSRLSGYVSKGWRLRWRLEVEVRVSRRM